MIYTEPELVSLLKSKDERAFRYLYDHYGAALYGLICQVLVSREESRDILQAVFLKIWKNMDSFDPSRGRLFTWMLRIARNTAIDTLRSRNFQQARKIRELDPDVHGEGSGIEISSRLDPIGLEGVLGRLSPDQFRLIRLAYYQGYTQEEIARELGIPLGTVKTRIRSTLRRLRELIN